MERELTSPGQRGVSWPQLREEFKGRRFLIVLGTFASFGGAERQALILARFLKDVIGAQVGVLASLGGQLVERQLDAISVSHWVSPFPNDVSRCEKLRNLVRLIRLLRRDIRPDFIIPFIGYNSKVMAQVRPWTRASYTLWNQRDEGRALYGSRAEQWALRHVDHVVSNSWAGRDFLCQTYGLKAADVAIINNGVVMPDVTRIEPFWRSRLGIDQSVHVVSMSANLTRFKDHVTLLQAWGRVHRHANSSGGRAVLLLAGAFREMTDRLKVLAYDERIGESVYLLGQTDRVAELMVESDLVVHSSVMEGCPNAVLEAMAVGRPVVATDIPGNRQALGDHYAKQCLARPRDPEHLAQLIDDMLKDVGLRRQVGEANHRRVAEEFSVDRMGYAYLALIDRVLRPGESG